MPTKYLKYELKGSHTVENVHAALGDAVPPGQVVRVHTEAGKTVVYLALDATVTKGRAKQGTKKGASLKGKEVSLDEVLRIG